MLFGIWRFPRWQWFSDKVYDWGKIIHRKSSFVKIREKEREIKSGREGDWVKDGGRKQRVEPF